MMGKGIIISNKKNPSDSLSGQRSIAIHPTDNDDETNDKQERSKRRRIQGHQYSYCCETCGIPTHEQQQQQEFGKKGGFFKNRKRTMSITKKNNNNNDVYDGICIQCHGELVPLLVLLKWYSSSCHQRSSYSSICSIMSPPIMAGEEGDDEEVESEETNAIMIFHPQEGAPPSQPRTNGTHHYHHPQQEDQILVNNNKYYYWQIIQLFQSCQNDPNRPTLDELETLIVTITKKEWKQLVTLTETTNTKRRLLHIGLRYQIPYPIVQFLLQQDEDDGTTTTTIADVHGNLPLHYVCRYGVATVNVLELLLRNETEEDPAATTANNMRILHQTNQEGSLPLHLACQFHHPTTFQIVDFLLRKDDERKSTVSTRDQHGYLPIHYALQQHENDSMDSLKVIQLLIMADTSTLHASTPSQLPNSSTVLFEIVMRYDYETIHSRQQQQQQLFPLLEALIEEMNLHTACRFGVPLGTIQLLLDMDSNQSVYKLDDENGNLPLHCAIDARASYSSSSSREVIRHLIKLDTSPNKKTIFQRNKDGSTPLLKLALRDDYPSILQGFPQYLLEAVQNCDIESEMNLSIQNKSNVSLELQIQHDQLLQTICHQRRMMTTRPSSSKDESSSSPSLLTTNLKFSKETWRRIVLIQNEDSGWLPLHWALAMEAPSSTIEFLLKQDGHHYCLYHPTVSKSLPIHFACLKGYNINVIQSLLLKKNNKDDTTNRTTTNILLLQTKNAAGKRPLDLLPKDADDSNDVILANLIVHNVKNVEAPESLLDFFFQSSPPQLFQTAMLKVMDHHRNGDPNAATVVFQWLNHAYCCNDSIIVFVMLEFTLLLIWIGLLVRGAILWNAMDMDDDDNIPRLGLAWTLLVTTVLVFALFLFRCRKAMHLQSYLSNPYNIFGFISIGLAVASSTILLTIDSDANKSSNDQRTFLMTTGFFQFLVLILFLKRVFHSIASFVGGVIMICLSLIPFAIVSGIILLAFAFLFFLNNNDSVDAELEDFGDAIRYSLAVFVRLPDTTSNWLDVAFATISVIVLWNVAIAVVNQNWVDAKAQASKAFWIERLDIILELGRKGDDSDRKWTPPKMLMRCPEHQDKGSSIFVSMQNWLKCSVLFLLGLVSFGLIWPLEMRRFLFSAPINGGSETESANEIVERLERKIQSLEETLEANHQLLLERKSENQLDELKSLIMKMQGMNPNQARWKTTTESARVNWTGKPQVYPPSEMLVAN
eukprot:scaffold363_cov56-Cylindrotheca_fusiformis.AAC.17